MTWRPATVEEITKIVLHDLALCHETQIAAFKKYSIEPYPISIYRFNNWEPVVVVARNGREVMYWEDVEEGFNISQLADDDTIRDYSCEQNDLRRALNA